MTKLIHMDSIMFSQNITKSVIQTMGRTSKYRTGYLRSNNQWKYLSLLDLIRMSIRKNDCQDACEGHSGVCVWKSGILTRVFR